MLAPGLGFVLGRKKTQVLMFIVMANRLRHPCTNTSAFPNNNNNNNIIVFYMFGWFYVLLFISTLFVCLSIPHTVRFIMEYS